MKPIYEMYPPQMIDELRRIAKIDRNWIDYIVKEGGTQFRVKIKDGIRMDPRIERLFVSGCEHFSAWGLSVWLADGPKVFEPTLEQCEAMEQIEVKIALQDYAQPYTAMMIWLPEKYYPFESVICFKPPAGCFACISTSADHTHDITTIINTGNRTIEECLNRFDEDCTPDEQQMCKRVFRIAVNSCLCLMNFGCKREPQFKKAFERDRQLASEKTTRGERARERLGTAIQIVSFKQTVKLHDHPPLPKGQPGEPTGCEMTPHWRRGHWRMQRVGKGRAEVKRVLVKPTLVRADRFAGAASDTETTYRP